MELFQVEYFGQLRKFSLDVLQTSIGEKDGCWLYNLVRGIETTVVSNRNLYKSISASKNFPGHTRLDTVEKIRTWCHNLSEEVFNRLEKDLIENKRRAKLLTVTCTSINSETIARSCPIHEYSIDRFASDAYRILKQFNKSPANSNGYSPALINLGIAAGKFVDGVKTKSIADLFSKQMTKNEKVSSNAAETEDHEAPELDEHGEEHIESEPDELTVIPIAPGPEVQGEFFQKFQKKDSTSKVTSTTEAKPSSSITSFFSRYKSNENFSASNSPSKSDDLYITCPKCNKSILPWNMPEHDDYHFAQDLQIEENRTRPSNTTNTSTSTATTTNRPSKTNKRKNEKISSTNQTLDAFLSKKPKI